MPRCTYYSPGLSPAELEATIREDGLADLRQAGADDVIVSAVKLVDAPEVGFAVPFPEVKPAKAEKQEEPAKTSKGK